MYSLPITTYADYWRRTTLWSSLGGALALWAGVSFSGLRTEPLTAALTVPISLSFPKAPGAGGTLTIPESKNRPQEKVGPVLASSSQQIITEYRVQEVAIPVEVRESKELPPGMKKVLEVGTTGLKRQVVKVVTINGDVQEQVIHEFELNSPKKRVVVQNSKPITGEPLDLAALQVQSTFTVEATAYTYTGNRTATGVEPRQGLIAVDPKVIPLGSRVYVEGYGYAIAADTGGAILGNKVDVFFPSLRECLNWGRRPVRLYLLAASR